MGTNKQVTNENERNLLYRAVEDYIENGSTKIVCPRCGKQLNFQGSLTTYRIACEDRDCISLSARGI